MMNLIEFIERDDDGLSGSSPQIFYLIRLIFDVSFLSIIGYLLISIFSFPLLELGRLFTLYSPYVPEKIKKFYADLDRGFKLTPLSRTQVAINFFGHRSKLINVFKHLRSEVDTLIISGDSLRNDLVIEETFLKSIPPHILHLNFPDILYLGRFDNVQSKQFAALCEKTTFLQLYKAFPRHLLSLSLEGNDLSAIDVIPLITELPKTLQTLNLSGCQLTANKLANIFSALSTTCLPLSSLKLSNNPDLVSFLLVDPWVTLANDLTLDMSDTQFNIENIRPPVRRRFLTALPKEVISLDFRNSNFFEWLDAITLPPQLIELGINADILINKNQMVQALPQLKSLKLSFSSDPASRSYIDTYIKIPHLGIIAGLINNGLGRKYALAEYIPSSVETLDLSHNKLGLLTEVALLNLLRHLPPQLRVIILDHNGLFRNKNIDEADALFKKIQHALPIHPVHGKPTVHLNTGNGYSLISQFGLLLTPKNVNNLKEKLHGLPCDARHLVYKFLGGRGALVDVEPVLSIPSKQPGVK